MSDSPTMICTSGTTGRPKGAVRTSAIDPGQVGGLLQLLGYSDIGEVAVFGVDNEEWGESVRAAVVPAHPAVTAEGVVAFARAHVAGYKVPGAITFLNELPKTGSGKVLKRQLKVELAASRP